MAPVDILAPGGPASLAISLYRRADALARKAERLRRRTGIGCPAVLADAHQNLGRVARLVLTAIHAVHGEALPSEGDRDWTPRGITADGIAYLSHPGPDGSPRLMVTDLPDWAAP
jgi:hypothetical protein